MKIYMHQNWCGNFLKIMNWNEKEIFFLIFLLFIISIEIIFEEEKIKDLKNTTINDIPIDDDILFVSNLDTNERRNDIYSIDIETKKITRITNSRFHHFLISLDKTRRYIDDNPENSYDDLFIMDSKTGKNERITNSPRNKHAMFWIWIN